METPPPLSQVNFSSFSRCFPLLHSRYLSYKPYFSHTLSKSVRRIQTSRSPLQIWPLLSRFRLLYIQIWDFRWVIVDLSLRDLGGILQEVLRKEGFCDGAIRLEVLLQYLRANQTYQKSITTIYEAKDPNAKLPMH